MKADLLLVAVAVVLHAGLDVWVLAQLFRMRAELSEVKGRVCK